LFIGGGSVQPNPFLGGHRQTGPKWTGLTRFATPNFITEGQSGPYHF